MLGGLVVHPFGRAKELLKFYRELMQTAPDELVAAAVLLTAPTGQKACGVALAYTGDPAQGERTVAPVKQFGTPMLDTVAPVSYLTQQSLLEAAMPPNLLNYWKAEFFREISDEAIEALTDAFAQVPSPISSVLFFPIRGAAARVAPDATAYPHRNGWHIGIYSLWREQAHNEANISWVRRTWAAIQPLSAGGVYVNELGDDEGADRVRAAYGSNYARLQRIKGKYDPGNLFCMNANIAPRTLRAQK
jgi:FAD/FMN-containing dehydrogenase